MIWVATVGYGLLVYEPNRCELIAQWGTEERYQVRVTGSCDNHMYNVPLTVPATPPPLVANEVVSFVLLCV